jgi:hypothetical protein
MDLACSEQYANITLTFKSLFGAWVSQLLQLLGYGLDYRGSIPGRGRNFTHLRLVPMLRMRGAVPPLPPCLPGVVVS